MIGLPGGIRIGGERKQMAFALITTKGNKNKIHV